jgi:hypothetical protein
MNQKTNNTLPAVVGELVAEMRELAQTSDDCQYGTISTDYVRRWADRIESTLSALTAEAGKGDVIDRLRALLPGLEFSRETHVQWRDCDQLWRDRNPSIGSSQFHDDCVKEYDERIATINDAIIALSTATPAGEWDIRMFDSQWVNVVNHAECYRDMDKEDAIAAAVKLTEQAMAANVRDGKWPLAASPRGASEAGHE